MKIPDSVFVEELQVQRDKQDAALREFKRNRRQMRHLRQLLRGKPVRVRAYESSDTVMHSTQLQTENNGKRCALETLGKLPDLV